MKEHSYGAKIKLIIEYEGDLEELCELISKSLSIPEFWFDSTSDLPYEMIAYCEVLGFEIDVQKNSHSNNSYIFSAITTDSFKEIAMGNMHDLSTWFSGYFELVSKLKTTVLESIVTK